MNLLKQNRLPAFLIVMMAGVLLLAACQPASVPSLAAATSAPTLAPAATVALATSTSAPTATMAATPAPTDDKGSGGSGSDDTGYGSSGSAASSGTKPVAVTGGPTIKVAESASLGKYLVDANGTTLYLFTKDAPGVSNCSGQCLVNWPPLFVADDKNLSAGEGITGKLDALKQADGSHLVTYNNLPLYYFIGDKQPGDVNGQGVGGVWFVVAP